MSNRSSRLAASNKRRAASSAPELNATRARSSSARARPSASSGPASAVDQCLEAPSESPARREASALANARRALSRRPGVNSAACCKNTASAATPRERRLDAKERSSRRPRSRPARTRRGRDAMRAVPDRLAGRWLRQVRRGPGTAPAARPTGRSPGASADGETARGRRSRARPTPGGARGAGWYAEPLGRAPEQERVSMRLGGGDQQSRRLSSGSESSRRVRLASSRLEASPAPASRSPRPAVGASRRGEPRVGRAGCRRPRRRSAP